VALHLCADEAKSWIFVQRDPQRITFQRVPPIFVVGFLERVSEFDERRILLAIEQQYGRPQSNCVHRSELGLMRIIPSGSRAPHIKGLRRLTGRCK